MCGWWSARPAPAASSLRGGGTGGLLASSATLDYRCDCVHIPSRESVAGDITTSPRRIFESMDEAEQDRVFGKAGAQAIRDGADIARVVNARRGMYTAGGLRLTREATTRRGIGRPVRLMPEEIYRQANGNRGEALRKEREARKALERQLAELAPLKQLADLLGGKATGDAKTDLERLTERMDQYERQITEERMARWRAEVAAEKGLSPALAERLR